jgi:hypothetical protein
MEAELTLQVRDGVFEHSTMSRRRGPRQIASRFRQRQLYRSTPRRVLTFRRRERPSQRRATFRLGLLKFDVLAFEASRHDDLPLVCYQ